MPSFRKERKKGNINKHYDLGVVNYYVFLLMANLGWTIKK